MSGAKQRAIGFLIGIDQAFNALGGGSPQQTISGTIGRSVIRGDWWAKPARAVVDGLFLLLGQKDHCAVQAAKEAKYDA